ncbi:hypothetical protein ABE504_23915 [Paenibacillus oryzisoli]|uniref:hypothetical protein n=1 Tax=Paenibacillus oryzisoli TaxID=1850517 RepID=UPI003D2DBDE2
MIQLLKFIVIRIFGRSFDAVGLSIVINILFIGLITLLFGFAPLLHLPLIIIFLLDLSYLFRAVWWVKRVGKKEEVLGYLRFDKTIEIHIAALNSPITFQRKLTRTIRYAQKNGYFLEYTSGYMTYGKVIRKFGDAVISIKTLGVLGQIWSGGLASTFTGKDSKYNVAHPLKVLLDPRKLGKFQN